MYRCYIDDTLFYEPGIEQCQITSGNIEKSINNSDVFTFTIPTQNVASSLFFKQKSIVEVYEDETLLFRGRVVSDEINLYNERNIECEGEMSYLNDTIFRPLSFKGTMTDFLKKVLKSHNEQVEVQKQIQLGNVTVLNGTDEFIFESIEGQVTRDVIIGDVVDVFGGYLQVRREDNQNYLDYLSDSTFETNQQIVLGANLLDFNRKSTSRNIVTGVVPFGAKIKNTENEELEERLTIKAVNNGKDYILDSEQVFRYGTILETKVWDKIMTAAELKNEAIKYLQSKKYFENVTDIKAIDLNMLDKDIQKLKFFHYVTVSLPTHDFTSRELIRKQTIDLLNPQNNTISIEGVNSSFTEDRKRADKVLEQIKADYVPNQKLNEVRNRLTEVESSITQLPNQIELSVLEKTYTKDEIKDKLSDIELLPGPQGPIGEKGNSGKGIVSTLFAYKISDTAVTPPTGQWENSIPDFSSHKGKYLWTQTTIKYTEGVDTTTYQPTYIPKDGEKGASGSVGQSIQSMTQQYYLSTSKTTQTGASWVTEQPNWNIGKYLWTRFENKYINPTKTEYTTPVCDSSWEAVNDVQDEINRVETEYKAAVKIEKERIDSQVSALQTTNNRVDLQTAQQLILANQIQSEVSERLDVSEQIYQKIESTRTQLSDQFNLEFTRIKDDVIGEVQEFKTFYRFTENEALIGKSNSQLEVTISNEAIQFKDSGSIVAYINGQKMYIQSLEVLNEIKMAYHLWEKHADTETTIMRFIG